jgi:ElaB/YqjD/DUF883 family membrane-anchored ribosome-binding protein
MSEPIEQAEEVLSSKEIFNQAIQEGMGDELPEEGLAAEPESLTIDHEPTPDDPDEYWKEFAITKGWKDNPDDVDPAYWTGYKAFIKNHDRIQSGKQSKSEVGEMKKQLGDIVKSQSELLRSVQDGHEQEMAKLKQQLEQRKAKAKDNLDFDGYEAADTELKDLESKTAKTVEQSPQQPAEAPIFVGFRDDHPELKHDGEAFDPELNTMVEGKINEAINETKSGLVRYQDTPQRKPPATNTPAKQGGKVALDPANLNKLDRKQYDHYMNKGWKEVAENVLKDALGA